ncbi:MqnA/MqnD/SBP family protein [Cohnella ginsengisoli]|uniref:MqnA/MqnD/SBP family protein n=1 Tax=Cohnella ginsengisoli TaxID=425004 RepID=UPI0030B8B882
MNLDRTEPIRIGRIDYTNVWPVFHHFEPEQLRCAPKLVRAMPAELNRRLREGAIDMAAISSFAYGLNSEDYVLLPNLSVSARGPVQSILLFLKSPLKKGAGRRSDRHDDHVGYLGESIKNFDGKISRRPSGIRIRRT